MNNEYINDNNNNNIIIKDYQDLDGNKYSYALHTQLIIILYPDGSKYKGQWENNKKNGSGTMKYSDGSEYNGQWENDKKNGSGTMKYPDGTEYNEQWENDEIKSSDRI